MALAWLLAGLLIWTGAVKLHRRSDTASSFADLGLPFARALAWIIPIAELATALLLVVATRAGGVAALLLLVAFTAFLARRLRGGATVSCGCFGSAHAAPLTSAALVRNGLLATAALLVAAGSGGVSPAGSPPLEAIVAVGTAGALGLLLVGLWDLRARIGQLWDNHLPTGPEGLA